MRLGTTDSLISMRQRAVVERRENRGPYPMEPRLLIELRKLKKKKKKSGLVMALIGFDLSSFDFYVQPNGYRRDGLPGSRSLHYQLSYLHVDGGGWRS